MTLTSTFTQGGILTRKEGQTYISTGMVQIFDLNINCEKIWCLRERKEERKPPPESMVKYIQRKRFSVKTELRRGNNSEGSMLCLNNKYRCAKKHSPSGFVILKFCLNLVWNARSTERSEIKIPKTKSLARGNIWIWMWMWKNAWIHSKRFSSFTKLTNGT